MRPRLRRAGLSALLLASLFLLAETAFYGDLDADGVLRESLFLPLGALLAGLGVSLLLCAATTARRRP